MQEIFFFFPRKYLRVGTLYCLYEGIFGLLAGNMNSVIQIDVIFYYIIYLFFFIFLLAQDNLFTSLWGFMFTFSGYKVVMGLCLSVFISALEYEYSCIAI